MSKEKDIYYERVGEASRAYREEIAEARRAYRDLEVPARAVRREREKEAGKRWGEVVRKAIEESPEVMENIRRAIVTS